MIILNFYQQYNSLTTCADSIINAINLATYNIRKDIMLGDVEVIID